MHLQHPLLHLQTNNAPDKNVVMRLKSARRGPGYGGGIGGEGGGWAAGVAVGAGIAAGIVCWHSLVSLTK
jgi:hypothetical protein